MSKGAKANKIASTTKGKAKKKSGSKKVSNPFSTGGGGTSFESEVQASFVALMLTGGYAPCLRSRWPIVEIKLQGRVAGYETDDLIVVMENSSSKKRRRLLCQVKHSIAITKGSSLLGEVLQAAWNDYRNPAVFNKNSDAIALITGPISETDHHNVSWLLDQAKHTKDAAEFFFNIQQTNFSPSKATEKLDALRHHLTVANGGVALSDEELFQFLKHFYLIGYDLDNIHGVAASLLHSHLSQFQLNSPSDTWAAIVREVQAWNRNAGTITRSGLPKELVDAFLPRVVTEIPQSLVQTQVKPVAIIQAIADATFVSKCILLGSWNDKIEADRNVVAGFIGLPYDECIAKAGELLHIPNSPFSTKDGVWSVNQRPELLKSLGVRVLDKDLDAFSALSVNVLGELDPAFELPANERYQAGVYGKVLTHSPDLRRGIAEGLALLANNSSELSNCTHGKPEVIALLVVRNLLADADWTRWGSLNRLLPTLAEASPAEFLCATEAALTLLPCPFDELSDQETGGVAGRNYMTGLLWALENLAWEVDMLVRVCSILAELASHDSGDQKSCRPFESLMTILLPWFPQTLAPFEKHLVVVRTLMREFPDLAWNLVLQLLPGHHTTSMGTHKPQWRKVIPDDWEARAEKHDYDQRMSAYCEMAIEAAHTDPQKLSILVKQLGVMPQEAFDKLLHVLSSQALRELPEGDRQSIWEALTLLIAEHRSFADAEWAFTEEVLKLLDDVTAQLAPADPIYLNRSLFSSHDLDLYDEKQDWNEVNARLAAQRDQAVVDILHRGGLQKVFEFAESVEYPQRVGTSLGAIGESGLEQDLIPTLLNSSSSSLNRLLSGFVLRRIEIEGWEWCDRLDKSNWTLPQLLDFLLILPFTDEAWKRASSWLGEQEKEYWTQTVANPYESQGELSVAIDKLLANDRPYSAIRCIERMRRAKQAVSVDLCTRALMAALNTKEPKRRRDPIEMAQLIKFVQSDASTNQELLAKIEWAYIPLLDGHLGVSPKLLHSRLAEDPDFFCDVIQLIFKSKNAGDERPEPTEEQRVNARHAWSLLKEWTLVPGVQSDTKLDGSKFIGWLQRVKERCEESGHLDVGLQQFGEVLIYAPADSNGLWIDQTIAGALNDKDADQIRRGFFIGTLNSRGVHYVDPTGAPERELAEANRKKANDAENAGFQRLAVTLRDIAAGYDREAEKIIHEHATEEGGGE